MKLGQVTPASINVDGTSPFSMEFAGPVNRGRLATGPQLTIAFGKGGETAVWAQYTQCLALGSVIFDSVIDNTQAEITVAASLLGQYVLAQGVNTCHVPADVQFVSGGTIGRNTRVSLFTAPLNAVAARAFGLDAFITLPEDAAYPLIVRGRFMVALSATSPVRAE